MSHVPLWMGIKGSHSSKSWLIPLLVLVCFFSLSIVSDHTSQVALFVFMNHCTPCRPVPGPFLFSTAPLPRVKQDKGRAGHFGIVPVPCHCSKERRKELGLVACAFNPSPGRQQQVELRDLGHPDSHRDFQASCD